MLDPSGRDRFADHADLSDVSLIWLWQQLGFPKVEHRSDQSAEWVVVIEVASGPGDWAALEDVIEALADWKPTALLGGDRYALQLHVTAPTAPDALGYAIGQHDRAAAAAGLGDLVLRRAEVLTDAEFEESCQACLDQALLPCALPDLTTVPTEVHEATRALLRATSRLEATTTLLDFVTAVGGVVTLGPPPLDADTVTIALPLSHRHQIHAAADRLSLAGLMLPRWLPHLIDDALPVLARLADDSGLS